MYQDWLCHRWKLFVSPFSFFSMKILGQAILLTSIAAILLSIPLSLSTQDDTDAQQSAAVALVAVRSTTLTNKVGAPQLRGQVFNSVAPNPAAAAPHRELFSDSTFRRCRSSLQSLCFLRC